jgi:hypothetical protein
MQNDPGSPPSTSLDREVVSLGSWMKSLAAGLIVTTLIFGLILNAPGIYFGLRVAGNWNQETGINGQEFATLFLSREFAVLKIVSAVFASLVASFLGGYVFSRIIRRPRHHYVGFFSCISVALILVLHGSQDYTLSYEYASYDSHTLPMQIAVAILGAIGGLLGIALATRKSRR